MSVAVLSLDCYYLVVIIVVVVYFWRGGMETYLVLQRLGRSIELELRDFVSENARQRVEQFPLA